MSDITEAQAQQLTDQLKAVFRALKKEWPWFSAVWAFDYDDPAPLADLIREQPIPDHLKSLVADIVSGKRKPNKKAAANAKIPADQRAKIFYRYWRDRLTIEATKRLSLLNLDADARRYKKLFAHLEPIDLVRAFDTNHAELPNELQELYGAGPDTLKALRAEGKKRMQEWPTG